MGVDDLALLRDGRKKTYYKLVKLIHNLSFRGQMEACFAVGKGVIPLRFHLVSVTPKLYRNRYKVSVPDTVAVHPRDFHPWVLIVIPATVKVKRRIAGVFRKKAGTG